MQKSSRKRFFRTYLVHRSTALFASAFTADLGCGERYRIPKKIFLTGPYETIEQIPDMSRRNIEAMLQMNPELEPVWSRRALKLTVQQILLEQLLLDLHTSWGGGQFRHPDFPKSLGNRENP